MGTVLFVGFLKGIRDGINFAKENGNNMLTGSALVIKANGLLTKAKTKPAKL